jgi:hypothetical protein
MNKRYSKFKVALAFVLLTTMTGCLHWIHASQTYFQMREFDRYFSVSSGENFIVHFKNPRLYSEDFVALAKLRPSSEEPLEGGKRWRYLFRKVDKDNQVVSPEISFFCDLTFRNDDKIDDWIFSKLFLQIAPAAFLEASFRSLGSGEINEEHHQLKTKAELLDKVAADLPKKAVVVKQLGEPLEITQEERWDVYRYAFKLDAKHIEEGYEDRSLSEVKLMFDKDTTELVKMSGRFAGLKVSINYRDYQENPEHEGKDK